MGERTPGISLPPDTVQALNRLNPWWSGQAMPLLPEYKRHLVGMMRKRLESRLAPAVVVRGPRQIGKTTAQFHLLSEMLGSGVAPDRILRVQFDDMPSLADMSEPLLRIVEWYEATILGCSLNDAAHRGRTTFLFFDEVQNLDHWAEQLKFLVDTSTTQVVLTGSSALQIERGRDSLAGRITSIEAGSLSLTEIAQFHGLQLGAPFLEDNGIGHIAEKEFWQALREHGKQVAAYRDAAFSFFCDLGGYPVVHQRSGVPWEQLADQLNENVIRRVLRHDLGIGPDEDSSREGLFEEVFRIACRYAGQSPAVSLFAREASRATHTNVGEVQVREILNALEDTLLIRLVEPLELQLRKRRGHRKICLADHGLRAAWLQEQVPLTPEGLVAEPHLTTLAGHIAESIVGTTCCTIPALDLSHLPARNDAPEVDYLLTVGTKRIPVEVKYQRRIDPLRDTEALRTFTENAAHNAPFGLLITQTDEAVADDPRIVCMPLSTFLLLR